MDLMPNIDEYWLVRELLSFLWLNFPLVNDQDSIFKVWLSDVKCPYNGKAMWCNTLHYLYKK